MPADKLPAGNTLREATYSLGGYVYQIYQSAIAWTELEHDEFLYLEVAEDFAILAEDVLNATQVKETTGRVTINSKGIVATINGFVELQENNPNLKVNLRYLTTSKIGKERRLDYRVNELPALVAWRKLAKAGDLSELRRVLGKSKLSKRSKNFVEGLDDDDLRQKFLKRIHFDCGALESRYLESQFNSRISRLLLDRGGVHSQVQHCAANILLTLLKLSANPNRDERCVDRNDLEVHLEKATQIALNRSDFLIQNQLITRALSAAVSSAADLSNVRLVRLSSVSETPLPKMLASREDHICNFQQTLETFGLCWITGAAGMGKTVSSRVLAHENGGDWASISLRSQSSEEIARILVQAANSIRDFDVKGLILDDLSCATEPLVLDSLRYLLHMADRSDVLLVLNSSDCPSSELLFACSLPASITSTLTEFTKQDIQDILHKCGVANEHWTKYVHLVSGGGHPQLAMAFIQSMIASGWDPREFQTLDALLGGSTAIDEVRKRTRKRLLTDLPKASRHLIERLSLKPGGFSRELAIDLGKCEPTIPDAGIVLETLIGSWIDQLEGDRFSLSPLLSGFAEKTLGADEIAGVQRAIADSLTKRSRLDVIDMNFALLAALNSRNEAAIIKLCVAILGSESSELERLAPHLSVFTMFRTDIVAYPANARISHLLRGAQLLLLNQVSDSTSRMLDALQCFSEDAVNVESEEMRASINLLVYSKLLLQTSKGALGVSFTGIVRELDQLLRNEECVLPPEILKELNAPEENGITAIVIMFLNQVKQLSKIHELSSVFEFLDNASSELRSRLLTPFGHDDLSVDMMVMGAWLSEHKANSIDPSAHSGVFARLEEQAVRWNQTDLAVCCRKYRAITLDEYGNDRNNALAVLDEGLSMFGQSNSELVRAKAKVLYRSDDHKGSLALSRTLIESDAPLSAVEKAFLGREAAISAEREGDFKTARRYYLFGSCAARMSGLPDMTVMSVGLLADAALASWHDGDRRTCLQDFIKVLEDVNNIRQDETLRTAHCHAMVRHVLLWLEQDATGKEKSLGEGKETVIYPGCVSNPEPHPEFGKRHITPIEMAWYMLAMVESSILLDAGITDNLEQFLPRGPVLEGQLILSPAKMHKALSRLDARLFVEALQDTISSLAFVKAKGGRSGGLDFEEVAYGTFPIATEQQQEGLQGLTEHLVLLFCAACVWKGDFASVAVVLRELTDASGFLVRPVLIDRLQSNGPDEDFYTRFAGLVLTIGKGTPEVPAGSPREAFELVFMALQIAQQTGHYRVIAENVLPWLVQRWTFVWERQRFQLSQPSLHEAGIRAALDLDDVSAETKVAKVLTAILPTLRISNQHELSEILLSLPR